MEKQINNTECFLEEIKKIESKTLQAKILSIQDDKEINALRNKNDVEKISLMHKYDKKFALIDEKICEIVSGLMTGSITEEEKKIYNIKEDDSTFLTNTPTETGQKNIKDYWKKALINSGYFKFNHRDSQIIEYLIKITLNVNDTNRNFKVSFFFDDNPYFENYKLTKNYEFDSVSDNLINVIGCKINWKKEYKDSKRKNEGFFDFFNKNQKPNEEEAYFFRDDFFVRHLGYYLGYLEYESYESEEEEEDENEEESDESDEDYEEMEENEEKDTKHPQESKSKKRKAIRRKK